MRSRDRYKKLQKATVSGDKQCALYGWDYPAAIKDENSTTDGYSLLLEPTSQRKKPDDLEGEAYTVTAVDTSIVGDSEDNLEKKQVKQIEVDVDVYVWDGDMSMAILEPWKLEVFITDRLVIGSIFLMESSRLVARMTKLGCLENRSSYLAYIHGCQPIQHVSHMLLFSKQGRGISILNDPGLCLLLMPRAKMRFSSTELNLAVRH